MIPLPCPFCGDTSVHVCEGSTFRWRVAVCGGCGAIGPEVRIQTLGDGTREEWEQAAHASAIAAWNDRPQSASGSEAQAVPHE